jgi:lactate permease
MVLAKLMTVGGDAAPAMLIGRAMAEATGPTWPYFAPLLGVLGSFFSGSNTVSNLTFAPIQAAVAESLLLDRATILALQSAGGAMGNMVCIHNIVAVGAVLGVADGRGEARALGFVPSVLKFTVGPLVVYALVAAAMAGVFAAVYA